MDVLNAIDKVFDLHKIPLDIRREIIRLTYLGEWKRRMVDVNMEYDRVWNILEWKSTMRIVNIEYKFNIVTEGKTIARYKNLGKSPTDWFSIINWRSEDRMPAYHHIMYVRSWKKCRSNDKVADLPDRYWH